MFRRLLRWLYAALYNVANGPAERAGLREQRHALLAQASGATIEIGAGTGLNLPHYPPAISRLVLIEPDPHMARRLRRRRSKLGIDAQILEATAEQLPFPDASFDTAVVPFALGLQGPGDRTSDDRLHEPSANRGVSGRPGPGSPAGSWVGSVSRVRG